VPTLLKDPLGRYRLMAYIVGTSQIVLFFIGIPLQIWAHFDFIAKYVGIGHGFLYLVYLVSCLELVLRYRLKIYHMLFMAAAGFVPFLSFVMERKMTKFLASREEVTRQLPRRAGAGNPR
jgi:integral membrane protein